jgi:hypothetical protein
VLYLAILIGYHQSAIIDHHACVSENSVHKFRSLVSVRIPLTLVFTHVVRSFVLLGQLIINMNVELFCIERHILCSTDCTIKWLSVRCQWDGTSHNSPSVDKSFAWQWRRPAVCLLARCAIISTPFRASANHIVVSLSCTPSQRALTYCTRDLALFRSASFRRMSQFSTFRLVFD